MAGYTLTGSSCGQKSSAKHVSQDLPTLKLMEYQQNPDWFLTVPSCRERNPPTKRSRTHAKYLMLHFSFVIVIHLAFNGLEVTVSLVENYRFSYGCSPDQLNLLLTKDLSTCKENSEVWFYHL